MSVSSFADLRRSRTKPKADLPQRVAENVSVIWSSAQHLGMVEVCAEPHENQRNGVAMLGWLREDDQPRLLRALRDEHAVICKFRACDLYNVWDYVRPSGEWYPVQLPCQHCGCLFPEPNVVLQPGSSLSAGRSLMWSGLYSRLHLSRSGAPSMKTPMMNLNGILASARPLQICNSSKLRCACRVMCRQLHLQTSWNASAVCLAHSACKSRWNGLGL